jgi:hypothetical protein
VVRGQAVVTRERMMLRVSYSDTMLPARRRSTGAWDMRNGVDLYGMFSGATAFNQLLPWDTARFLNISYTFSGAARFNSNINTWRTNEVSDMSFTFSGAELFNQPLVLQHRCRRRASLQSRHLGVEH